MKKNIIGVMATCVLIAIGAFLWWIKAPNRTILRNSSNVEITNVCLTVQNLEGTEVLSRNAERIGKGESIILRHSLNDSRVTVIFYWAGNEQKYTEDYVDLWVGEGWVLDVMQDGSIQSGYQKR